MTARYAIRPFATLADYQACVELQESTWGQGFSERVSPAILKVTQILGGVAAGAYAADGSLAGFVFGMTGVRDGEIVHWSDMLAVRPEIRDAGLGRRLKEYQREEMLRRDIRKMYWTFDPLQARNAHLNFNKLGIVVREYEEDMYGDTDSPLHRGIGTDRFIALWLLDSDRVVSRLSSSPKGAGGADRMDAAPAIEQGAAPLALDADRSGPHPVPLEADLSMDDDTVGVSIPSDIVSLMNDDLPLAVRWRSASRATLGHYLQAGYEVRGFERGGMTSTYLLTRTPDTE